MTKRVLKWMETARWAASGGNAQPWSVAAREADGVVIVELKIDATYMKRPSPMDVDGLASALALGCLAKNLEFVAANDGCRMTSCVASASTSIWSGKVTLEFKSDSSVIKKYSDAQIIDRVTNRYPFRNDGLSADFLERMRTIMRRHSQLRFAEVESRSEKSKTRMIPLLSKIERVRCRNAVLLGGLLHELSFSEDDGPTKIPVTQLGLPPIDQKTLLFFHRVPMARGLFKLGLDALPIRRAVHDAIVNSERVFFIESELSGTSEDFKTSFEFGRTFQELWLEANSNGVGFQPIGLPLIALGLFRGMKSLEFTPEQEQTLTNVTNEFKAEFGVSFRNLVMGFRLGLPTKKAIIAPRKPAAVEALAR